MMVVSAVLMGLLAASSLAEEAPMGAGGTHTAGAASQSLGEARLLVSKFLLSSYAVQSKDLIVDYRLYNVGDRAALNVVLDDRNNFPTNYFDVEKGQLQVKWARIPAGTNVTHSVAIRPRTPGTFNYTAAQVTYTPSEEAGETKVSWSSAPGEGYIYALKDYERKFSPHVLDWLVWTLMALPCLLLPAALFHKSATKYRLPDSKKKSN